MTPLGGALIGYVTDTSGGPPADGTGLADSCSPRGVESRAREPHDTLAFREVTWHVL